MIPSVRLVHRMKIVATSLLFIACLGTANAQIEDYAKNPSKSTLKYREFRQESTTPTFGLAKVKKLVKTIKPDSDDNRHLNQKAYDSLTVEEKFTYTMIHGEDATQNCDVMPVFKDEEKKIFGYIPGNFHDETTWSDRQRKYLKDNRETVIKLIRRTILDDKRVGVNLKSAILEIDGVELIPDLAKVYNAKHYDHDILTVMMLLMKEGKFEPFAKSQSFEKLYGEHSNYRGYIMANTDNQKLVIDRAMAYFKQRMAKK